MKTKGEVNKIVEYECSICNKRFAYEEEAQACADKGFNPEYRLGDIFIRNKVVDISECTNKDWIYKVQYAGRGQLFYVLTSIDQYPPMPHVVRYHFKSLAKGDEVKVEGNVVYQLAEVSKIFTAPDEVVRQSRKLIGGKAEKPL